MPRRYGADGTRLWNGKTPEEFTEADAYRFMAETEAVLDVYKRQGCSGAIISTTGQKKLFCMR